MKSSFLTAATAVLIALGSHGCMAGSGTSLTTGTQPSGIRGTKVVIPKVRNLCPSKSFPPNSFERRLMPARKQIRPFTRNRHLTFECFNGEGSERNFGDTVRSLRIRHSGHRISKIHLVLTLSESAPCRSATLSL
jgi:hypothetical protein